MKPVLNGFNLFQDKFVHNRITENTVTQPLSFTICFAFKSTILTVLKPGILNRYNLKN